MPRIICNDVHVANFLHGPNMEFMGITWVDQPEDNELKIKIENHMYDKYPGGTIIPNKDYTFTIS